MRPCSRRRRYFVCRGSFRSAWSSARDTADLKHARWLLPAYLGLFSVVVVPVVALGTRQRLSLHTASDTLILTLPMSYGARG